MTALLTREAGLFEALKAGAPVPGVAALLGEAPLSLRLDRVHFPRKRPPQLQLTATLPLGLSLPVLAEYCPGDAEAHAAKAAVSLAKSRNGQRAGLRRAGPVADARTGLVLRLPGLDERLPGLRLLHEPGAARAAVTRLTGRDPGPLRVRLMAHRLGKRAVLQLIAREGALYARLRPVKSGDGQSRYARHAALWQALGPGAPLAVPDPLGEDPALGLSLFSALPGTPPDFEAPATAPTLAAALERLQGLALPGLPVHDGASEARLLAEWHARVAQHFPGQARALTPALDEISQRLAASAAPLRPSHRDLHEKQILIAGGCAGLLDFDTLSLADPALDGGNLLAHLFMAGLPERPFRRALARPGIGLWRRAALLRLAMIYAFTSTPGPVLARLSQEACQDDRD